jgi:hypothetical protein
LALDNDVTDNIGKDKFLVAHPNVIDMIVEHDLAKRVDNEDYEAIGINSAKGIKVYQNPTEIIGY